MSEWERLAAHSPPADDVAYTSEAAKTLPPRIGLLDDAHVGQHYGV